MIEDTDRGSFWTQALLGIQADEIHLCGDPRPLNLIRTLCRRTNDILVANRYERLSNLIVEEKVIKSVEELKTGDCLVAFSRQKIFELQNTIN
jgi:ATP-dependent RNA helicase SUPV3L1/SUV3